MAKIKFGMMMTDARGKLGGHVFSKNKAGSYIRTKVTPTNPQTAAQSYARSLFASISASWSSLSESVRAAWNNSVQDWARTDVFGDLKNPTGKALFQRLNNQAQSAGLSAVTEPPAKVEMPSDIVSEVAVDTTLSTITLTGAYATTGMQVVISATPVLSDGTRFVKNKLRQIYAVDAASVVPADLYSAYVDKFGAPASGDNVYFAIKYVAPSGQVTPQQTIKASIS